MRKFLLLTLFLGSIPSRVFAQITPGDTGLQQTGAPIYGNTPPNIGVYIGERIVAPALGIIGVLFLLLMIYAGFLWMTAAGNETQLTKAKGILTNSLIGTFIIVLAYTLTRYFVRSLAF